MPTAALEFLIILLLILINGLLAMTEIAVVSARKTRLQQQAEAGIAGAQAALDLANDPGRLLSTVQIGITLVGILAGAFGGAAFAGELAAILRRIPFLQNYAASLSVVLVVILITYLSLVIGELAPKQVGLAHAERIAAALARPMILLSRLAAPAVALLGASTTGLLRMFGFRPSSDPEITEEEIKIVIERGTETGVLEPIEEEIVGQVFRLSDQRIRALMTPRTEVAWIDQNDPLEAALQTVVGGVFSQYPLAHESLDNVTGFVQAKDLLRQCLAGGPLDLAAIRQPALFLPEAMPVFDALEQFRQHHTEIALVLDEYGGIQGLVTTADVLEAIVGQFPNPSTAADPDIVQREDGSYLLDGLVGVDRFTRLFDIPRLPPEDENLYQSLGGFVMTRLGRIPRAGDVFEWTGLRFEVVDMDGRRVDKILVKRITERSSPI